MCLSRAYLDNGEERTVLKEEVTRVIRRGDSLVIRDLMGETKEITNCFIREIDFIDNKVILGVNDEGK